MTLASALTALCDLVRTRTGAEVILGFPDDGVPGVYVWPWRLEEDVRDRNAPPRVNPDGTRAQAASTRSVHFLVLVRPALTADGLAKLDEARQAIIDHPILDLAGEKVHIALSPLAVDRLTALFTAASLPLTICVSATLGQVP
jgi:hypothetical protein